MSIQQLEDYAKKLRQPKLVEFCLELGNYIRRLEQQSELREEFLKRSQKQIEDKNQTIEEKDVKIERLEKERTLVQREQKTILVPEKDTKNKELDESVLSITEGTRIIKLQAYIPKATLLNTNISSKLTR